MRPGLVLLPLLFVLAGCGGGGSSRSDAGLSKITIDWPATTRSFAGSPIAGSALIVFTTTATPSDTIATFPVVRPSGSGEAKKTYTLPRKVAPGTYFLTVRFCSESSADPTKEVGVGATAVTVGLNGRLQGTDGNDLGDIAFANTLKDLALLPNQTVRVGQLTSLSVQATSSSVNGQIVAIPFTQVSVSSSDASVLRANEDGTVTGVKAGTANVTVMAFGLTSPAVPVTVTSS